MCFQVQKIIWSVYLEAIPNWSASYVYSWVGWNSLRTNKTAKIVITTVSREGNSLKSEENLKKLKNLFNLSLSVCWSGKIVYPSLKTWLLWIITEKMGHLSASIKNVLVPLTLWVSGSSRQLFKDLLTTAWMHCAIHWIVFAPPME